MAMARELADESWCPALSTTLQWVVRKSAEPAGVESVGCDEVLIGLMVAYSQSHEAASQEIVMEHCSEGTTENSPIQCRGHVARAQVLKGRLNSPRPSPFSRLCGT